MRRAVVLGLVSTALAGSLSCGVPQDEMVDGRGVQAQTDILLPVDSQVIQARFPRNGTLATLLRMHQVEEHLAQRVVDAALDVFDLRKLKADQPYRLETTVSGAVRELIVRIDRDRFLRVVGTGTTAEAPQAEFDAEVVPYEKRVEVSALRGYIDRDHSSIVAAMNEHGENVVLAMSLADVFGGDIDFTNDLQVGDSFDLVFEKIYTDGEFAGYGDVLAAEFRNDGRVLKATRYTVPGGDPGYYDDQGRSLKRFFLRSPLKFEPRISSGFSYRRLHPVLGTWRSHPAIDYVAPVGAPVIAVAAGVVTRAGWMNGGGNTVTIRHTNGYESNYLHLSKIEVKAGERVAQGTLVGKVGATGLATGPHLDYRLKRNGQWVNPLTEHKKLPPGEPVPAQHLAAFQTARDTFVQQLAGLGPLEATVTTAANAHEQ